MDTRDKSINTKYKRIVILSNVYDENYELLRAEAIPSCLSAVKRKDLHECLAAATSAKIIIISSPPRASHRRKPRWLGSASTSFGRFPQLFSANYDARFVRIPFSWLFYICKVVTSTRRGDITIIDNYEFMYVLAALAVRFLYGVPIILEYEDGKHLTDKGWHRFFSGLAELLGKPFISGAILAQPLLSHRLPPALPTVVVPGFVVPEPQKQRASPPVAGGVVRFVYSGTLDRARGIELLLEAIDLLPPDGWSLDITGDGPLAAGVSELASRIDLIDKVRFHRVLDAAKHRALLQACDIGLNLQLANDPISSVTFPSKVFTYLSHELYLLSSSASEVPVLLGRFGSFYAEDNPATIADAMVRCMRNLQSSGLLRDTNASSYYSVAETSRRVKIFFDQMGISFA